MYNYSYHIIRVMSFMTASLSTDMTLKKPSASEPNVDNTMENAIVKVMTPRIFIPSTCAMEETRLTVQSSPSSSEARALQDRLVRSDTFDWLDQLKPRDSAQAV